MLRTIAEALGIFIVSILVLWGFYTVTVRNATGVAWVNWKGEVLIWVGVMYIVCGLILTRIHR